MKLVMFRIFLLIFIAAAPLASDLAKVNFEKIIRIFHIEDGHGVVYGRFDHYSENNGFNVLYTKLVPYLIQIQNSPDTSNKENWPIDNNTIQTVWLDADHQVTVTIGEYWIAIEDNIAFAAEEDIQTAMRTLNGRKEVNDWYSEENSLESLETYTEKFQSNLNNDEVQTFLEHYEFELPEKGVKKLTQAKNRNNDNQQDLRESSTEEKITAEPTQLSPGNKNAFGNENKISSANAQAFANTNTRNNSEYENESRVVEPESKTILTEPSVETNAVSFPWKFIGLILFAIIGLFFITRKQVKF